MAGRGQASRAGGPIGVLANAASGKDIRRLVAHASVVGNDAKRDVVRRVVAGALAAGATELHYLADPYRLVESALDGLDGTGRLRAVALRGARTGTAADTTEAAAALREEGCAAVVTLGGDGTNRAAARGWRDVPVVAISTGTNNAFPRFVEGTVAGMAAALVATGRVGLHEVARPAPVVEVRVEGPGSAPADGDPAALDAADLALVDAVVLRPGFVGARALWDPDRLRLAVVTRPDPAAVGVAALAGLCAPAGRPAVLRFVAEASEGADEPNKLPRRVRAALAPGLVREVAVAEARELAEGEVVEAEGPCLLAFDGERERAVPAGATVRLRVAPDGPQVIDVAAALRLAAERRVFEVAASGSGGAHGA